MALQNVRALVFDAYGTLFDVHAPVRSAREALGDRGDALSSLWRRKQLEYTWLRSLMGRHADFWQVTREALEYAMAAHGIDDSGLRERLLGAYLELDCYPEVPKTLAALKAEGRQTAILSNGSPEMLRSAVAVSGLGPSLDFVLSVEEVQVFKPDPRVYRLASHKLGVEPSSVGFLSSNAWDIAGASSFGFPTIWVNRFDQERERLPGRPDAEIRTLESVPGLLEIPGGPFAP
jgi:2-haloacid dehalogenase